MHPLREVCPWRSGLAMYWEWLVFVGGLLIAPNGPWLPVSSAC